MDEFASLVVGRLVDPEKEMYDTWHCLDKDGDGDRYWCRVSVNE